MLLSGAISIDHSGLCHPRRLPLSRSVPVAPSIDALKCKVYSADGLDARKSPREQARKNCCTERRRAQLANRPSATWFPWMTAASSLCDWR